MNWTASGEPTIQKPVRVIDGSRFTSLTEFYDEVERVLLDEGAKWGRNLDAFNDVMCGGWGTPEEPYVLIWKDAALSRNQLGYEEMVRVLEQMLKHCHHLNRPIVADRLEAARCQTGPTVFDWLIDIIDDADRILGTNFIELRFE